MAEFDRHSSDYRKKLGNSMPGVAGNVDRFALQKVALMAEAIPGPLEGIFLDFGSGIGLSVPHIRSHFPAMQVICADPSLESLAQIDTGEDPMVSTVQLSDAMTNLATDSVQLALAACVFHHIAPDERDHWFAELRRVIAPGGKLWVFEHNPWNPGTQWIVRNSPLDENAILLKVGEVVQRARKAGFNQTRREYTLLGPPDWTWLSRMEKLLSSMPLGAQYFVEAS